MIDFTNAAYVKLSSWDLGQANSELADILITNEVIHLAFKGMRDSITFTDRRLIAPSATAAATDTARPVTVGG